jgi:hypothetical protein
VTRSFFAQTSSARSVATWSGSNAGALKRRPLLRVAPVLRDPSARGLWQRLRRLAGDQAGIVELATARFAGGRCFEGAQDTISGPLNRLVSAAQVGWATRGEGGKAPLGLVTRTLARQAVGIDHVGLSLTPPLWGSRARALATKALQRRARLLTHPGKEDWRFYAPRRINGEHAPLLFELAEVGGDQASAVIQVDVRMRGTLAGLRRTFACYDKAPPSLAGVLVSVYVACPAQPPLRLDLRPQPARSGRAVLYRWLKRARRAQTVAGK